MKVATGQAGTAPFLTRKVVTMMVKPSIVIDGKTVEAGRPKAKAWRELYGREADFGNAIDVMVDGIVLVFNRSEVTPDAVFDNVDLAEIPVLYRRCVNYVVDIFTEAMETAPKNV